MLPLQQSSEIKYALTEYLKATFRINQPDVNNAFVDFLSGTEGMFKGPYLSARLPFREGSQEGIPLDIKPTFPPYQHQWEAFHRLSTQTEGGPQPTLITTGTASGKTECFLYPVLDHCYRLQGQPGVKVIILYPMNALATDQAKRLAEAIWNDERLRGNITAGLFIGEGKDASKYPMIMGRDHIIENRTTIVNTPPDILLTNFKMLDYGLMRHTFHHLWNYNLENPALLRFIVLDELHTYDGAQGTDVANLIRRLKLKLNIPKGTIVPVGTSATIGSGNDSKRLLAEYASKVFGEDFSTDSIIEENRLVASEYFADGVEMYEYLPPISGLQESRMKPDETYDSYIERQKKLWRLNVSDTPVELGEELKRLTIVRDIVEVMSDKPVELKVALRRLCERNEGFRKYPETEGEGEVEFSPREELLNSIWALMAEARRGNKKLFPFVYLQAQLWVREFSGVLREVGKAPKFVWRDRQEHIQDAPLALPPYFCRECGASGWLGVKQDNNDRGLEKDPLTVYDRFFQGDKNVYYLNYADREQSDEYKPDDVFEREIDPYSLQFTAKPDEHSVRLRGSRKLKENQTALPCCPECGGSQIAIIGTKIPTLSSISVSQLLASDLDPRVEKERKTLAFTNSVQDAAHQAGFIGMRNYRFTLRNSLQKVINQYERSNVSLEQLIADFIAYWKKESVEKYGAELAYFHRFFPTDVKASIEDFQTEKGLSQKFREEFEARLSWEIVSEFGFNSRIGRTLEKTGASGCSIDPELLELVAEEMMPWLAANKLDMIGRDELCRFINMLLHRVRMRGGVSHEYLEKARNGNMERWDLNWNKDGRHFLNRNFGPKSRLPKMIGSGRSNFLMDSTHTPGSNMTWFKAYFMKTFLMAPNYNPLINDFYAELLLKLHRVLDCKGNGTQANHAIRQSALLVGNEVTLYQCNCCSDQLTVLAGDKHVEGAACLGYRCTGHYELTPNHELNYYRQVYNRSKAPRIYATEHTGLLERKDRENKEIDFKTRPHDDSLNVLVATSTLEMGIDIGTLNSVINNSVPPLTSNYLQRVGRAGRSTGSAMILNFAKSQSHDLFYYEDPLEMMCGTVHTPGCFLEAKDILFRHFFAFCIDSWTREDPEAHVIIPQVRILGIRTRDLNDSSLIHNRWIDYIKTHQEQLLEKYVGLYKEELGEIPVLDELCDEIRSGRFFGNLRYAFQSLKMEYDSISEKIKELNDRMKERNLAQTSDEYKELDREKRTLGGLRRLIDKRSLLEYLTNCGLLPNYAFPETGITLRAIVKDDKSGEGIENQVTHDKEYEVVRGAQQGLRELAPGNTFYTQGYKMEISGIDTSDWKDEGILQRNRFCSNCDHLAADIIPVSPQCPKCGDASWGAASNVHSMMKLNGVKSVNRKYVARIMDNAEERDKKNFRISRHLDFDPASFAGAMAMKDLHFGIEYVKKVKLTEINLGQANSLNSNTIKINQIEKVPVHGFVTCRHCGRSTDEVYQNKDAKDLHYGYCKHKQESYKGVSDEVFEELYLFRNVQTEALKIILPTQDFDSQNVVEMFKEGLNLGIKKYYNGNPDHLGMCDYREFNPNSGKMDNYLVIYDKIPGGTGYLRKLFDKEQFSELLKLAYAEIRDCKCQYEGKDGCYRCIYTYGNQFHRDGLSRSHAEQLFKKLLERSNDWEDLSFSLGGVPSNGYLEESELEDRFVYLLKNYAKKMRPEGWNWEDVIIHGQMHYMLTVLSDGIKCIYQITPQYELNKTHGVKYTTRPDFYFKLVNAIKESADGVELLEVDDLPGVAVYLDGYAYHASKEHMNFFNDVNKRLSLIESGQHLSWTLTWDDLTMFEQSETRDELYFDKANHDATLKIFGKLPLIKDLIPSSRILRDGKDNMHRFTLFLETIVKGLSVWEQQVTILGLLSQTTLGRNSVANVDLEQYISKRELSSFSNAINKSMGDDLWMISDISKSWEFGFFNVCCQHKVIMTESYMQTFESLDPIDKESWHEFWHLFNLYQVSFAPKMFEAKPEVEEIDESCLEYFDEIYHPIVRELIAHHIPFDFEGTFFLEGTEATAVLGWADKKIFMGAPDEDKAIFFAAGYTEMISEEFDINRLK